MTEYYTIWIVIITAIISSIVSGIIVWFVTRFLKGRGKIRCEISDWKLNLLRQNERGSFRVCSSNEAAMAEYSLQLQFFNEKELQTGLRNISLVFQKKRNKLLEIHPKQLSGSEYQIVDVINLPSREFISVKLRGTIQKPSLSELIKSDIVYFVGYLPNGKALKSYVSSLVFN